MKALVTGGAGFIGSHLVEELISMGFEVHIIDNLETGQIKNIHPIAIFHKADIRSNEAENVILTEKFDIVFHLAAQVDIGKSVADPSFDASVNIAGTLNILEACRRTCVQKLIFASSSAVYGEIDTDVISETDPTKPISFYGASKLSAETYIRLYYHLYKLPYTILRFGNVYGPRQMAKGEGGVVAIFLNKIKHGKSITINGDGEQTRDFIYVKDIVQANISAINNGDQDTFNVSTSKPTSINDLEKMLTAIHGSKIETAHVAARKGDITHSCLNNQKGIQSLAWSPNYPINHGLAETYASIIKNDV